MTRQGPSEIAHPLPCRPQNRKGPTVKLWVISQTANSGYDTYDSAVVAADTEELARLTMPSEYEKWGENYSAWAPSPDKVKVELIGDAAPDVKAGVIVASFNAG